jgi:hypothetical protein
MFSSVNEFVLSVAPQWVQELISVTPCFFATSLRSLSRALSAVFIDLSVAVGKQQHSGVFPDLVAKDGDNYDDNDNGEHGVCMSTALSHGDHVTQTRISVYNFG